MRAAFQVASGTVCHVDLTLVPIGDGLGESPGTELPVASGPIQPGPCPSPTNDHCLQFIFTGSFTVHGIIAVPSGLLPGDIPIVRIPVVNMAGVAQGMREVQCVAVVAEGRLICSTAVTEAGLFVPLGGIVEVRLLRPVPSTPTPPLALLPLAPLLPPLLPPPPGPPAPLLPPPLPLIPREGAAFPEVPVIPEAGSLALFLTGGLVALGGLLAYRRLRRPDR